MLGGVRWPDHKLQQVQRRTIWTLVAAQSLGGLGITIGIAVAALLAEEISGSESLAGLAQTMQVRGAAVASVRLAHLMGKRGRRPGLLLGYSRKEYTYEELEREAGYRIGDGLEFLTGEASIEDDDRAVITFEGAELVRGGGGARCMTMPIRREDIW